MPPGPQTSGSNRSSAVSQGADFEPACRAAFDNLRAALIELYASVGADPESPQDAARRFKVNKTLTWNISKLVASTDAMSSLPNVPGDSSLRGFLSAMKREGANSEAVERVRNAAQALQRTVELHVSDRGTLELIVDGMGQGREDHLELSRKLAFRGNSGLWGVQAKTRLMTAFLAPNVDKPDRIDMAIVRGYIGFRRLRSDVQWPIFQLRGWGDENESMSRPWQPLTSENGSANGLPLLSQFSTVGSTDVQEVQVEGGIDYLLAPPGRSATPARLIAS